MARTISTRFAIEGEAEQRAAVNRIGAEYKKLESALKLVESEYKNNANSMEALRAKSKALADIQSVQKSKIDELNKGYTNAQSAVSAYEKRKEELTKEIEKNKKALEELQHAEGDTTEEQKKLTEETARLEKQLKENDERLLVARQGVNYWERDLNNAKVALNNTNEEIKKNDQYLDEAAKSADGCADSIDKFGNKSTEGIEALSSALAAAGLAAAIKKIAEAMWACAESSIEFESALTGVAKTTDLSAIELGAMGDALKEMSTTIPITTSELAGIAENAGQLGIQKESILGFTKVMADLGVATDLSGEQAAQTFAKFANITRMSQKDFDRLGSAIVDLGNNLATTEASIADMSMRLAAAGTQAGMTQGDILGIAGALSSLGLESQAGGTAFSKVMNEMTVAVETGNERLTDFANVANMSADQFARAYKENAAGALSAFIVGLGDMETHGKSATVLIEELGLTEIRLRDALTRSANAQELFTSSIARGNAAWKSNTALTKEAELRYGTTESQLQILKNSFNNLKIAIGDQLNPTLKNFTKIGEGIINWATDFVKEHEGVVPVITAVVVALGVMAAGIAGITVASTVGAKALVAFKAALDTATGGATLIITAIVAAVAALTTLALSFDDGAESAHELTEASRESVKELENIKKAHEESKTSIDASAVAAKRYVEMLEELEPELATSTEAQKKYKLIVDQLSELYPELNLQINENTHALEGGTAALKANMDQAIAHAKQAAAMKTFNEVIQKQADIENEITENQVKHRKSLDHLDKARKAYSKTVDAYNARVKEVNKLADEEVEKYGQVMTAFVDSDPILQDLNKTLETQAVELANCTWQTTEYEKAIAKGGENLAVFTEDNADYIEILYGTAGAIEESTNKIDGLTDAQQKEYDSTQQVRDGIQALAIEYDTAYQAAYESISSQIGLFEDMSLKGDRSIDDLIGSLKSQTAYMDTYASNIQKAMELGVDKGLVQKLSDGSKESAEILDAIVKGGAEKIPALNEEFAKVQEGKDNFAETIGKMAIDFDEKMAFFETRANAMAIKLNQEDQAITSARQTVAGYIDVFNAKIKEFEELGRKMGAALTAGYKAAVKIQSPSRVGREDAKFTVLGYTLELEKGVEELQRIGKEMGSAVTHGYADQVREAEIVASAPIYHMRETKNNTTTNHAHISLNMTVNVNGKMNDQEINAMVYKIEKKIGRVLQ